MAAPRTIQLYYDVVSPYAWIGFEAMCRYRSRWNIKLDLCPFYLAGIMGGSGNKPPGVVPAKASYMGKDIMRLREHFQIPLNLPKDFAEVMFRKGSLKAQRLLTLVKDQYPDRLEPFSRQLWMRIWSRDEDITEDSSLCEAGIKAGFSQSQLDNMLELTKTDKIKEMLKQRTQEALELGAFGAPFIVAHMEGGKKERFFGSDRLELLAFILGEKWEGPLPELKAQL